MRCGPFHGFRGGKGAGTLFGMLAWLFPWVALVALAFAFGEGGVIVLFALLSLLALREFVTLTYTRRGDYLALVLAFYLVLPMQYALIAIDCFSRIPTDNRDKIGLSSR